MIPRVIHYCWFGGKEKPEIVLSCIETWKRYFPDWEIMEWNESNFDINSYQYVKDAYELKKWAFVSDVVRFHALNKYGGIYLDVDVEFIKPLPDHFLELDCFTGYETLGDVNPGLIFGVIPNYWLCQRMLESYRHDRFINEMTVNIRMSKILEEYGLVTDGTYQNINGVHIYPAEYFCGYDTDIREPLITDKTICWHHYLGSWKKKTVKIYLQDFLKKIIGKKLYKQLILFNRSLKNN